MPESASLQVKYATTGVLFHPFSFGEGVSMTVTVGGSASMLNGALVTDALLPARSVAEAVTV